MNLTKDKRKAADIAVAVIDFIETKVHEVVQDNELKEQLIDSVIEMVNEHYKIEIKSCPRTHIKIDGNLIIFLVLIIGTFIFFLFK